VYLLILIVLISFTYVFLFLGNPGDSYWEQLSESRRVALEATWKENMDLHSKVMELEYENTKLKALLAESQNAIKMLTVIMILTYRRNRTV